MMSVVRQGGVLCLLILSVSAAVNHSIFQIPIFEVREIVNHVNISLSDLIPQRLDWYSVLYGLLATGAAFLAYYGFKVLFVPLDRVKLLGDLGYIPNGKFSKKDIANDVKRRRVVGDVPPVYPNGWFGLLEGWKLKRGHSMALSVLGQELVVFRDTKGLAHVLDAYCPHMGANLGVGGRVVGDCIECPFHGWKFRGHDGKCMEIPYSDKALPSVAKTRSWPSVEINGWIHLWFHAEGLDPTWTIPEFDEITTGTWQYKGRTEHYINAHIEEVPENGADVAHLKQVHEPFLSAGVDLATMWNHYSSYGKHEWQASWEQMPSPDEHVGCMTVDHCVTLFGFRIPGLDAHVKAMQIGPGIVYLRINGSLMHGAYLHYITPVEPLVQKVTHNIYCHWMVPNIVAKFYMVAEAIQIERDVMIWNNKKYQAKPVFTKTAEDSLIARHRRWYSQFYSENSPRLKFQKETLDW